ncbi:MAG TPA: hypothetical protein VHM90_13380 [Phycisphaerae bacterium]|jgi:hypothetical protein|nr:hypothetical protein [Phycisphaerae bacterium]
MPSLQKSLLMPVLFFCLLALPARAADPARFVKVDAKHVLNLAHVVEAVLRKDGNPNDNLPWSIDIYIVGIKDPQSIYFPTEKEARNAWDHLLSEMNSQ